MKKALISILAVLMLLCSCTGLNTSVAVNVATDTAFVLVLQNNPTYKAPVIAGLQAVKTFLAGNVTYDDLILEIAKLLPGKYAVAAVILQGYIDTDKPIFETHLALFDEYKIGVIAKIDRLLILASI